MLKQEVRNLEIFWKSDTDIAIRIETIVAILRTRLRAKHICQAVKITRFTNVRETHDVAIVGPFTSAFPPVLDIKHRVFTSIMPLTYIPSPLFTFDFDTGSD